MTLRAKATEFTYSTTIPGVTNISRVQKLTRIVAYGNSRCILPPVPFIVPKEESFMIKRLIKADTLCPGQ